jgi:hypothetical protein
MKLKHRDAHIWILAALVSLLGVAVYHFSPRNAPVPAAATAGILVLILLKHVGLFSALGAPIAALLRGHLRRRSGTDE